VLTSTAGGTAGFRHFVREAYWGQPTQYDQQHEVECATIRFNTGTSMKQGDIDIDIETNFFVNDADQATIPEGDVLPHRSDDGGSEATIRFNQRNCIKNLIVNETDQATIPVGEVWPYRSDDEGIEEHSVTDDLDYEGMDCTVTEDEVRLRWCDTDDSPLDTGDVEEQAICPRPRGRNSRKRIAAFRLAENGLADIIEGFSAAGDFEEHHDRMSGLEDLIGRLTRHRVPPELRSKHAALMKLLEAVLAQGIDDPGGSAASSNT
jgi:hypothetical protein